MIEMLQYGFMQRAFITGILLAVIAPLIGITIVLKRMSMIGDALSHASLAGVALGLLLGINPILGAMGICLFAALGDPAPLFGTQDFDFNTGNPRSGELLIHITPWEEETP